MLSRNSGRPTVEIPLEPRQYLIPAGKEFWVADEKQIVAWSTVGKELWQKKWVPGSLLAIGSKLLLVQAEQELLIIQRQDFQELSRLTGSFKVLNLHDNNLALYKYGSKNLLGEVLLFQMKKK